MRLAFYKTNLSLSFSPWEKKGNSGREGYDRKSMITTVSDENVAVLYFLAKQISEGTLTNPVCFVLPCNKEVVLRFEFNAEQASLTIEKKGEKIPFPFAVARFKEKVNGVIVEKVVQSGLLVFKESLAAYLLATAADRQRYGTVEELYPQQQSFASSW